MNSYYYNELPTTGLNEEALLVVVAVMMGILGVILLIGLTFWILRSMSLHKIAKRRGIRNAWLAWIPIGGQWVLGSVSDQYQHLVQNKITSRRKILLILNVAGYVVGIVYMVLTVLTGIAVGGGDEESLTMPLLLMIPYLLTMGVSIATVVFYHMSNYDLYRSCNPKNAVVFLILGIIFPVCEPFFYFSCRKKDLGMIVPQPITPEPAELPQAEPEF